MLGVHISLLDSCSLSARSLPRMASSAPQWRVQNVRFQMSESVGKMQQYSKAIARTIEEQTQGEGMMKTRNASFVLIVLGFFAASASVADDASSAATDTSGSQELKDMQADAALAKAKLELAQSEVDLLKLKFGAIDTTNLPKGNATVADMNLEGSLRAYAAAKQSLDEIAGVVQAAKLTRVILAADSQLQALNQYRSFMLQLDGVTKKADEALSEQPPSLADPCIKRGGSHLLSVTAIATGVVAVNSLLSIAALFKKDIDLKGKEVTLNDYGITSLMLRALADKNIKVIYPAAHYVLPPANDTGDVIKKWTDLYGHKKGLNDAARNFSQQYAALPEHKDPTPECKNALARQKTFVDDYVAGLAAAAKTIDDIDTALTKQDAQSGLSLISSYLVSERVAKSIQAGDPVLQIKAIAASGSTQTKKNWFRTKISYGGGSIIAYQLFGQDGTVIKADTVPWYAGYIEDEDFAAGRVSLDKAQ